MADLTTLKNNETQLYASSKSLRKFIEELLDEASFVETDVFLSGDSLLYDSLPYGEGVITGYASIGGYPVYIVAQNSEVLRGSFGTAGAKKILKCIQRARKNQLPLISIIDSSGIRAGEGVEALDAFAEVFAALTDFRYYSQHICIVQGSAVGLFASYAAMSDFVFMGEKGRLSVLPPMVLQAQAGSDADTLKDFGADVYANSKIGSFSYGSTQELATTVCRLLAYLNGDLIQNSDDPNRQAPSLNDGYNKDTLIAALADDGNFIELYEGYCPAVFTALTSINSLPVGVVVTNADGASPKLDKSAIKKIRKFIQLLDAYDIPLINLVDCEGIEASLAQEQASFAHTTSRFLAAIADTDITKISIITGSAIGFAYTALCAKPLGYDFVAALPTAKISAITAAQAIDVFFDEEIRKSSDPIKARELLTQKYNNDLASPFVGAKSGSVDNIIEPSMLRPYVSSVLAMTVK